jgi:hemerythrin-like domain-containing protein
MQDHLALLLGLNILDGMIKKLEDGDRIEMADAITTLKFLHRFGDEYHQTMEETVLIPSLLHAAPEETLLRAVLADHDEERTLSSKIEDALKAKSGPAFVHSSRQLTTLLRNHFSTEDSVFGSIAERSLTSDQDSAIAAEFLKNRVAPETLIDLSKLEWKYSPQRHEISVATRSSAAREHGAASYR